MKLLGWRVACNILLITNLLLKRGIQVGQVCWICNQEDENVRTYLKSALLQGLFSFIFLEFILKTRGLIHLLNLLCIFKNSGKYFNLIDLEWYLCLSLTLFSIFKINDAFMARIFLWPNELLKLKAKFDNILVPSFHKWDIVLWKYFAAYIRFYLYLFLKQTRYI